MLSDMPNHMWPETRVGGKSRGEELHANELEKMCVCRLKADWFLVEGHSLMND